ncbi:MAG: hypothetical protein AAB626_02850, partial [Patescibacteria group bacterium]
DTHRERERERERESKFRKGSWTLSATVESDKYLASNAVNDKGQSSTRFELGNNLALNKSVAVGGLVELLLRAARVL